MYYISIVDSNRRKLVVAKEQSQAKIDKITTSFKDSGEFITDLGLNPSIFKVIIEKQMTKEEEPVELLFLDNRFKDLVKLYEDKENQEKFFDFVSKLDRKMLYDYFLNEYVTRYENVKNDYDRVRKDRLDKIIDILDEEQEYENSNNETFFSKKKLSSAIRGYFIDQYGNVNYNNFKHLYRYLTVMKQIKPSAINQSRFDDDTYKEFLKIIKKIGKSISNDGLFFDDNKIPTIGFESDKYLEDEEINYSSIIDKDEDIDDKMTELGIYMDSEKMDEEQKFNYIENNKKGLF